MDGGPGGGQHRTSPAEPSVGCELAGGAGVENGGYSALKKQIFTPERPEQPCTPDVDSVVQRCALGHLACQMVVRC